MANTFITMQAIARRALATLYNTTVLAGLVYRDYDEAFTGKVGDTVTVRKPATFTAEEFERTAGITIQNATETGVDVKLDTILDVSFAVTAEELTLNINDFATRLLNPALEAIVQAVDEKIATTLLTVTGTATGNDHEALIEARKVLNQRKVPMSDRFGVWSPRAAAILLNDPLFHQADQRGDTDGLREASIGRKFGFDNFETQAFEDDGVAFHRDAVALVSRTLDKPMGVASEQASVENYKGLGIRVVREYDITKKQDVVSLDFLCGTKLLDGNRGIVVNVLPEGS